MRRPRLGNGLAQAERRTLRSVDLGIEGDEAICHLVVESYLFSESIGPGTEFAQMMIPHHEQAIEMSDMVLAKSGVDPDVTALARQIKSAQQPEIDTMKAWLNAWGHPPMSDRGMQHDSGGGMMTDEEMQQLEQANGTDGQRLFLEGMVRHHEGAIRMAQTEIDAGKNPETINLAKNIATSQQKEIDTMRELLTKL
jgi:uncharacterized protein (DUF305 family)